ncbi:MAG: hypothetical protein V4612_03545 [Pseudomonadota bacterium]
MPEFHDYSSFVKAAYLTAGIILFGFALFSLLQLKKNETALKKISTQKK